MEGKAVSKMNLLNCAIEFAKAGFYVFPVAKNSKIPAIKDWPNEATRDLDKIKKWWGSADYNIGIFTGKFKEDEALIVIDVDNKDGRNGNATLERLHREGNQLVPTLTQETPTGGKHFIYRNKSAVTQGTAVFGEGIDTRSSGGYIVGAGSEINGGSYTFGEACEVNQCPEWVLAGCKPKIKRESKAPAALVDDRLALERATDYLSGLEPITAGGRNDAGFKVACRLRDFGVDEQTCFFLMGNSWKCEPLLDLAEIEAIVKNAYQYSKDFVGNNSPEALFGKVQTEEPEEHYLEKINKEWALVFLEGSHVMIREYKDEKGFIRKKHMTEASFKRYFSTDLVTDGKKTRSQAEIWLDWPKRREFEGFVFMPEQTPPEGYYNLWRGFAVEPVAPELASAEALEGFKMFKDHLETIVCGLDDSLSDWLWGYFAHLIQKPYERPLTTLVFKGAKGVGKNAVIERIGRLFSSTQFLVAQDSRYLTSNFNGHLESCLCLVLDEAFWSGDKAADGKLKGLSTSPTTIIERKGQEPYVVPNLTRIVIIGNEDWLVPASADERRYAVIEVNDGRKQDIAFFEKMTDLMDNKGGASVLLHYLKNLDISKINVNRAPNTKALYDQKVQSLNVDNQWLHDGLLYGALPMGDFSPEWDNEKPLEVAKEDVARALKRYYNDRNAGRTRIPNLVSLSKSFKKIFPSMVSRRVMREGKRANYFIFPSLNDARKQWDEYMGFETKWE